MRSQLQPCREFTSWTRKKERLALEKRRRREDGAATRGAHTHQGLNHKQLDTRSYTNIAGLTLPGRRLSVSAWHRLELGTSCLLVRLRVQWSAAIGVVVWAEFNHEITLGCVLRSKALGATKSSVVGGSFEALPSVWSGLVLQHIRLRTTGWIDGGGYALQLWTY